MCRYRNPMTAIHRVFCATLAILLWSTSSPVAAQQPRHIAWLGSGSESGSAVVLSAFKQGLKENGLIEGRDYVLDARYADNRYERFPALTQELLQRDPAVIVVVTIASVRAAQRATTQVPIVMMGTNDPVGAGLIASLARPGGNTTGLSTMAEDVAEKYLQLLRDLRPRARRLAVLVNPENPSGKTMFGRVQASARELGISAHPVELKGADDIDAVFDAMVRNHPDALAIASDLTFFDRHARICAAALHRRIPILAPSPDFADGGCLVGFGTTRRELYRRAATYVRKLFDGAKPGDLPVELPTRVELAINLKSARALGLKVPRTVLVRADKIIE